MARYGFGQGVADFVVAPADGIWTVAPNVAITFWTEQVEGDQYTDLLSAGGTPVSSVTSDEYGQIPRFSGPDDVFGMWADAGGTGRAWLYAHTGGKGAPGTPGAHWFFGTAEPTDAGLTPVSGDLYVNTVSGDLFAYDGTNWSTEVNLLGPAGEDGVDGAAQSVMAYGAVGDGTTDDSAAIQAALDATAAAGGGVVAFPARRTYAVSTYLHVPARTTIKAHGATIKATGTVGILRNWRTGDSFTGYDGNGDITIEGGTWDANAADGTAGTVTALADAFTFGHARRITIRDVIIQNVSGAHAIDLAAVAEARILDSRFEGFRDNTVDSSRGYSEAIQIDYAISGSGAVGQNDGTPCRDVLIQGCSFGASSRLPAFGRAIGSHTSVSGVHTDGVQILGCRIEAAAQEGIRAYAWRAALIAGNIISGTGQPCIAVTGPNPATAGYNLSCDGVTITGNDLRAPAGDNPIKVQGFANARVTGLHIANNRVAGSPASGIYVFQATAPSVSGNRVSGATTSAIFATNCSTPQVVGNMCLAAGGSSIGLDTCTGGHVGTNVIEGGSSHGIYVGGGSDVSVQGNRIHAVTGSGIRATSSTARPRITHNTILRGGVMALGIDVTASATGGVVIGNDLSGSAWPVGTAFSMPGLPVTDWAGGKTVPGNNLAS
ncbi:right-handed parallel beta-helix repeat-containing protein [Streptomyces sp. NPDC091649]|uniref:right-handed parallel beta-helix repeat-containing protein n=1 Tax=Streptomyces sp. NPDC091649 TaxID=3366004 RepID=UPI00380C34EE